MSISKDSKIEEKRQKQKSLLIEANLSETDVPGGLKANSSESASLCSITDAGANLEIRVKIQEKVKSVQKVQVINQLTGEVVALSVAPAIVDDPDNPETLDSRHITFSVVDPAVATDLQKAVIEVCYKN